MAAIASSWAWEAPPADFQARVRDLMRNGALFGAAVLQARREREGQQRIAEVTAPREAPDGLSRREVRGLATVRSHPALLGLLSFLPPEGEAILPDARQAQFVEAVRAIVKWHYTDHAADGGA